MITMEKIDYVMSMTNASYEKVREALLDSNGDVDVAISNINATKNTTEEPFVEIIDEDVEDAEYEEDSAGKRKWDNINSQFEDITSEIMDALKEFWEKGNASKLVVLNAKGETVISLSLAVSALGAFIAPFAAILGLSAAALSKYDFLIYMNDGEVIDLMQYIRGKKRDQENKDDSEEL